MPWNRVSNKFNSKNKFNKIKNVSTIKINTENSFQGLMNNNTTKTIFDKANDGLESIKFLPSFPID